MLGFCQQRGLPTDDIRIVERVHSNPYNGMVEKIDLEILRAAQLPGKIPRTRSIRSAELCAVKKHLENPPKFEITTQVAEPAGS